MRRAGIDFNDPTEVIDALKDIEAFVKAIKKGSGPYRKDLGKALRHINDARKIMVDVVDEAFPMRERYR